MSLMRSLTKVAAGVMLAKGIGTMMNNQHGGRSSQRKASGGLLDNLLGNNTGATSGGSLNQMLGRALGGGTGTGSGSLGGLLDDDVAVEYGDDLLRRHRGRGVVLAEIYKKSGSSARLTSAGSY